MSGNGEMELCMKVILTGVLAVVGIAVAMVSAFAHGEWGQGEQCISGQLLNVKLLFSLLGSGAPVPRCRAEGTFVQNRRFWSKGRNRFVKQTVETPYRQSLYPC